MNVDEIIRHLKLQPHPREDGFFVEAYRSNERISWEALPARYDGQRSFGTAIFFLLKAGGFSEMHRLRSDEIFHFYLGSPAEMLLLYPDGGGTMLQLGSDLSKGEKPQIVVPSGTWQGMRTTGEFTLFGCTVSPGFEYSDYESGNREDLVHRYLALCRTDSSTYALTFPCFLRTAPSLSTRYAVCNCICHAILLRLPRPRYANASIRTGISLVAFYRPFCARD